MQHREITGIITYVKAVLALQRDPLRKSTEECAWRLTTAFRAGPAIWTHHQSKRAAMEAMEVLAAFFGDKIDFQCSGVENVRGHTGLGETQKIEREILPPQTSQG